MESQGEKELFKHRRVAILGRDNADTWFRQMRNWLEAEGIFWVVETTLSESATESTQNSDTVPITEMKNLSLDNPPQGGTSNAAAFRQKDAKAKYWIELSLNEFDQERVEDAGTAKEMWTILLKKYKAKLPTSGRQYLAEYTNYKMGPSTTIDEAWQHISRLGKKVAEQRPELKSLNHSKAKFQQLLSALPVEFQAYRAGIDTRRDIAVDEGLEILTEAEQNLRPETGLYAKKPGKFHSKEKVNQLKGPTQDSSLNCYLCNGHGHQMRNCVFLEDAKRAAVDARRKKANTKQSKDRMNDQVSEMGQLKSSIDGLMKQLNALKTEKRPKKAYTAETAELDSTSETETSTDDNEYLEETATYCKENVSVTVADAWISDSGASSHMTDNPELFSSAPRRIRLTTVVVGGGKLYSNEKGTITVQDRSGNQFTLCDVLHVPGLGVNLLSGRKLCKEGLQGYFDDKTMHYIDKSGDIVLEAKERGGVYILDKISASYQKLNHADQTQSSQAYSSQSKVPGEVLEKGTNTEFSEDSDHDASDKKIVDRYRLYHRRFAHLGPRKIGAIHKMTTLNEPIKVVKCGCQVCHETKMTKKRGSVVPRKQHPLERVSIDTCGPFPMSREGFTQAMTIKDDYSRYSWMIPIKDRKECPGKLRTWKIKVEKQSGYLLKAVRVDNASELVKHFEDVEKEEGVEIQTTVPNTSTQNGLVEKENRQIQEDTRATLKDAKMPPEFWVDACQSGIYVRNRISNGPTVDGHIISPYEAFTGQVPNVDHIRVWGCKVYSYMERESIPQGFRRDKLMDKARIGVFIGYIADTSKQFLIWAPDRRDVIKSSNIVFCENEAGGDIDLKFISKHSPSTAPDRKPRGRPRIHDEGTESTEKLADSIEISGEAEKQSSVGAGKTSSVGASKLSSVGASNTIPKEDKKLDNDDTWEPNSVRADSQVPSTRVTRSSARKLAVEDATPTKEAKAQIPVNLRAELSRKRSREESNMDESETEPVAKQQRALLALLASSGYCSDTPVTGDHESMYYDFVTQYNRSHSPFEEKESAHTAQKQLSIPIPQTYHEALADQVWGAGWKEAIDNELTALAGNRTWTIVTPPQGANLITSKWVFATKFNTDGSLDRLKARLVARGFSQKFGVDYEHTFAPTLKHDTLRAFMALCATLDLECHAIDVNNAFTESFLKEDIYMRPPHGVNIEKGQCLKVNRSLYGLKQAARDWNEKCVLELQKLGFVQSDADPCLLIHPEKSIILLVYVDDILIGCKELASINWFKDQFGKVFKIKDLGEVKKILGVQVTRDRTEGTIRLDQAHYIREILSLYKMEQDKAKKTAIPMNGYDSLRPAGESDTRANQQEYQTLVGKLLYLAILTRPDISFALGRLSQYLSDPAEFHMVALKHVLKYLRSTIDQAITFGGRNPDGLVGYSDSDFASDRTDRLSVLGNVFMLANGPISWSSKKQKSVATSTMDAEYMAMCSAAKQSQWLALMLRDMGAPHVIGSHQFKPLVKEKTKFMIGSPVLIRGDNQAALGLIRDAQVSERSKHIDVAYHYQRDLLKKDRLKVEFVGTLDMVADGMTKPLAKVPFRRFLSLLGMCQV